MKKTTQIATDRAYDQTKTVLPAEVARGVYMQNVPSLRALKLMHLMIAKAGGRMAEPVRHEFRLADIRQIKGMKNHDKESLKPLFEELRAAVLTYDDTEAMRYTIGGLLDQAVVDYRHKESGDILVSWYFGRMFIDMAAKSNHWAILDRQTAFAMTSKYSVLLFQYFASLQHLDHKTGEVFTVGQLRAMLGVPEGKLKTWNEMNRYAFKPAISEINQLARFTLTATPRKIGRTVASVEISWEPKPDPTEVKRELDRPKAGRKSRRNGTAETPVVAFPASGGVKYTDPWNAIRMGNCNWDQTVVADSFRAFLNTRKIKLDAKNIENLFETFCKKLPNM